MPSVQVRVQQDLCCGFGNCAWLCPEVFELDFASNRSRMVDGAPVDAHREQVLQAAQECPTQAITVVAADA